jgi:hypothetical protein
MRQASPLSAVTRPGIPLQNVGLRPPVGTRKAKICEEAETWRSVGNILSIRRMSVLTLVLTCEIFRLVQRHLDYAVPTRVL